MGWFLKLVPDILRPTCTWSAGSNQIHPDEHLLQNRYTLCGGGTLYVGDGTLRYNRYNLSGDDLWATNSHNNDQFRRKYAGTPAICDVWAHSTVHYATKLEDWFTLVTSEFPRKFLRDFTGYNLEITIFRQLSMVHHRAHASPIADVPAYFSL